MILFLALIACETPVSRPADDDLADDDAPAQASSVVAQAAETGRWAAPVTLPPGAAVARSCFGGSLEQSRGRGYPPPAPTSSSSSGYGAGGGNFGGSSSASTSSPGVGGLTGAKGSTRATAAAKSEPAPAAEAAAPSAAPAMPMADASADVVMGEGSMPNSQAAPRREAKPSELKKDSRPASPIEEEDERMNLAARGPSVNWGGTTWLSNDDSMSLASAQRLLYAVKQGVNFSPSDVRPHELLNYFSFDTSPVARGDTFSVLGSAEQTSGDALTLALAVRGASPPRQPLDLTLVVDVSGSMSAEGRMTYVKRGLTQMTDQLVRGDRVDLVVFDHQVCTALENYVVGRDDPSLLASSVEQLRPRGSTNLDLGLKEGYRLARQWSSEDSDHSRNHRVMVLTDALLNTGDVDTDTVSEIGKALEESQIRLTGVGVGRDFNDRMLDKLTEKGKGAYVYLGSEAVVDRIFGAGFNSLTQTVAHDVRFSLALPPSLGLKRFYGEESSTNKEDIQPIHYYADTSQLFLQDLYVRDGRVVPSDRLTLTMEYRDVATDQPREQRWTTSVGELLGADRHNVRKGRALMAWSDFLLARAMGGDPCGEPLQTYRSRASSLSDDAEIGYVNSLTGPLCGVDMSPPPGVAYRVRLDSDMPIAEVALACSGSEQRRALSSGESIASFQAVPGSCTLTLQGTVPMTAQVKVPSTGGDVRCTVRGGRLSCSS